MRTWWGINGRHCLWETKSATQKIFPASSAVVESTRCGSVNSRFAGKVVLSLILSAGRAPVYITEEGQIVMFLCPEMRVYFR